MASAMPYIKDQRGIALVVVLWVTVLLSVMAGVFSSTVRSEARGAANLVSQTRAYYMAAGGVNAAMAGIIEEPAGGVQAIKAVGEAQREEWRADGRTREVALKGGTVAVRVFDEAGKMDVNMATRPDLVRVFVALGVKGAERDMIIDSILDWRDENNFNRINGAEDAYYKELDEPYEAKDAPLNSIDELLWVKGVTPGLFYGNAGAGGDEGASSTGLRDMLTVYTGSVRVNVNTAPVEMLMSLPGVDREAAEAIVERRESLPIQDFSVLAGITRGLAPGVSNYVTFASTGVYTIEATASLDLSAEERSVRAVVIAKKGTAKVLSWKDRTYDRGREI